MNGKQALVEEHFKNYGCPVCYNETKINPMQLVDETNSLSSQFQKLLKNGILQKMTTNFPTNSDSFLVKNWWQCKVNNNHEWHARISDRTKKRSGCPICYKVGVFKTPKKLMIQDKVS